MSEWDNLLRALGGVLLLMSIMICSVVCLYKYAVCQENKNTINVVPRQYSNLESKHNSGVGIIVTPQNTTTISLV